MEIKTFHYHYDSENAYGNFLFQLYFEWHTGSMYLVQRVIGILCYVLK